MKMRSAFFTARHQVCLQDIPLPEPNPDEVLVEIIASGICGSDLHRYAGMNPWGNEVTYPFRAGHEMAGIVSEVGNDVKALAPGQAVAIEPMQLAGCEQCRDCQQGHYNRCQQRATIENRQVSYGFSDYDIAKASHLHCVPNRLPLDIAALADVYACALHAINRTQIEAGQSIAIIGTGAVALALGQIAKQRGIEVTLVGRRDAILELALQIQAADNVIKNSMLQEKSTDNSKQQRKMQTVFEVVGGRNMETMNIALELVAPGGNIVILGAFADEVQVCYQKANRKEISLRWSNGYALHNGRREFAIALEWLAAHQTLAEKLITHRLDFTDIQHGFQLALNKSTSNAVKVMLFPQGL